MRKPLHNSLHLFRQIVVSTLLIIVAPAIFAEEIVAQSPIAIVVHKDMPVEDLSLADLRSIIRAEMPRGPKIVLSTGMALDLVVAIPGSISFTGADTVTDEVKVVRVNGLLPSDDSYPLKSERTRS